MTDVRLTATNPLDSSVVPVACNEKGELLLEDAGADSLPLTGGNLTGNLTLSDGGTTNITLRATGGADFAQGGLSIDSDDGSIRLTNTYQSNGYIARRFSVFNGSMSDNANRTISICQDGTVYIGGVIDPANPPNHNPLIALRGTDLSNPGGATFAQGKIVFGGTGTAVFDSDVVIGSRNKKWMIVESNGLAHLVEQTRRGTKKALYPPLRDIPGELTMVEQQLQKVMERLKMAPEAGWEVWDGSD